MTYPVDIVKMIIASLTSIVFIGVASMLLAAGNWVFAIVFLAIAAIYAYMASTNGSFVRLSEEDVQLKFLGIKRLAFRWREIQEVGVVGVKVLKSKNSKRTGTKYIYFSRKKMTDEERFDMCLSWAPKDVIYVRFNDKRIKKVRQFWKGEITLYNTANLVVPN